MFADLLNNGAFTTSHLFVVLCTGLAFFAVQLALCFRVWLRMRREERVVEAQGLDAEPGEDERHGHRARSSKLGWVDWVLSNFAADATPGSFSREDALAELDARIASNGDYLALQRMGVMAPLLGVVLTVIGFYWLELGDDEQSLQTILLAVAPLVSGVGAGAVLALVNQVLLHVAGHRAESLRLAARRWFDTAIWRRLDGPSREAAGRAVAAMDALSVSLGEANARYVGGAAEIVEATSSMSAAAKQFREMIETVGAEMRGVPEALREVRRATTASADALEELIRVGSRAVANLDVSVAAFRSTIDREYAEAAKLERRVRRALGRAARQLDGEERRGPGVAAADSAGRVTQQAESLRAALSGLEDALAAIEELGKTQWRERTSGVGGPAAADVEAVSDGSQARDEEMARLARRPR